MLLYLLKLTISLSIVYIFYQLFLRKLTFYNWNRWYLLIYSMLCFVIPFVNVFTIIVEQPSLRESAFVNYIPAITQMTPDNTTSSAGVNWWLITGTVFIIGILVMVVRLGMQYYSLYKMRSKAVLLYDNEVKLYHIDAPVMPFSFGRGIYVNQHQHSEHELKEIIRHEFIHVKQRHSLDIIWSELLCILNWYNPFAWLLRHDIRQNLEFIADQQVLQTGLDRKQYQYLLLKVIGVNSFSIANNFNFSSLKKRIAMMNKAQSARVHLIRFLFLLPLLVVVLLAFRNSTQNNRQSLRQVVTDTLPTAEKIYPGWKDLEGITVKDDGTVIVRLKDNKAEIYDLNNNKERKAFEAKYGPVPVPPPPPPAPPKPTVLADINVLEAPLAPIAPEKPGLPEAPVKMAPLQALSKIEMDLAPLAPVAMEAAPVPPPPPPPVPVQDCYNQKGFCVNVVDNQGEPVVIVKDKNNKIVLAVSLDDWKKDKQYEEKYGEAPIHRIIILPKPVTAVEAKPAISAKASQVDEVVVVGKPAKVVFSDNVTVTANKVSIKPATTSVKVDEVVAVNKPIGEIVVKNSPQMMEGQSRKVVVTPSNGYMLIANGHPVHAVKVAVNPKTAVSVKVAAEAKVKAEAESHETAQPKPAAPTKEQ